ncbi:MAG TPA: CPBP family glutamic-type intramembrane protease [Caulobacteraceae bacterium]|jgi:hypothetical protein|nr:CPBP family glutamic-type intramembrane protease [Caulobacteraceae bacterium]
MTQASLPQSADPGRERRIVGGQLAIVLVLAAVILPLVSPAVAASHGAAIKAVFLARMAVLIAVATWLLHRRGLGWAPLGLRRPAWGRFAAALIGGLVAAALLSFAVRTGLAAVGVPAQTYAMFASIRGDLGAYLFWLIPVSWLSAAMGEELLFRGFILDGFWRLLDRTGAWRAPLSLVLQALIFGLLHAYQGLSGAATAAALGLVLGAVWWGAGRNLWAGIVLHAILDSMGMTAAYLGLLGR